MECPLVGRVSMDMLTVDLRHQPNAKIGDPVVLWGEGRQWNVLPAVIHLLEILTRMTPDPRLK